MSDLDPTPEQPQSDDQLLGVVSELRDELVALKQEVQDIRVNVQGEPDDSALSQDELDALMLATTQLEASSDPDDPAPAEVPEVGVLLSDEEIASLLNGATEAQQASEADIVSADDIKAMLGLREQSEETDEGLSASAAEPVSEVAEPVVPPASIAEIEPPAPTLELVTEADPEPESEPEPEPVAIDLDTIHSDALQKVSGEWAARALALPICLIDGTLHCLSVEPFDQEALDRLGESIGLRCVAHSAPAAKVVSEIRMRYGVQDEADLCEARTEPKKRLKISLPQRSKQKTS